jgi:hypothetical protein
MKLAQKMRERHVRFVLTKYATLNFYIIERVLFHRISDSETLTKRDRDSPQLK